jgi:hypothetical protein
MQAARCAPALCGGKPTDLAAGIASHQSNFLAARLNGTENPPKQPAIRRMSVYQIPSDILLPNTGEYLYIARILHVLGFVAAVCGLSGMAFGLGLFGLALAAGRRRILPTLTLR